MGILIYIYSKLPKWSKDLASHQWAKLSNNGGLSEESIHLKITKIQPATESEFLPRTPSLLDPSSGTKWSVKTRSESAKEKSFQSARFSSARLKQSRTTESYSSIIQEPMSLTCTRSTEATPSVELFLKCTTKWLVDIVPELSQSILSRLSFSQIKPWSAHRSFSMLRPAWGSLSSPRSREPQLLLTRIHSLPRDPPSCEERNKNPNDS